MKIEYSIYAIPTKKEGERIACRCCGSAKQLYISTTSYKVQERFDKNYVIEHFVTFDTKESAESFVKKEISIKNQFRKTKSKYTAKIIYLNHEQQEAAS